MGLFNNRELATAFWLLILVAFALRKGGMGKPLAGVVRAFCQPEVLAYVFLMLLYVAAAVTLLTMAGFWGITLLKDTIVRFGGADDSEDIFRNVVGDSFKIVIVLEFLFNTYTFPLPAELIIVPILGLIGGLHAVATSDEKYSAVVWLTENALAVIGFSFLALVLLRVIADPQDLFTWHSARSIALAPLLSLILSPYLYALALITRYGLLFRRLNFGLEKERQLKRYARRRIMTYGRFSPRRVQHLLRNPPTNLMRVQTEADVDRLLE